MTLPPTSPRRLEVPTGGSGEARAQRPYRPPTGLPRQRQPRVSGAVASVALHLLILLLVLAPSLVSSALFDVSNAGAGGTGAAGGGGGGARGTGGSVTPERLQFIRLGAPAAAVAPPPAPVPPPTPVPVPTARPVVTPPLAITPAPQLAPAAPLKTEAPLGASDQQVSAVPGTGGGSGNDGTGGSGPGSGGGTGSGLGTGRGSGVGAGTGGGLATVYPPTPTVVLLPPMPVPSKIRPYQIVAVFDVDTLGNATLLSFNPSPDAGYNRRVREMLGEVRFRPAVRLADGRPVRDTARISVVAH